MRNCHCGAQSLSGQLWYYYVFFEIINYLISVAFWTAGKTVSKDVINCTMRLRMRSECLQMTHVVKKEVVEMAKPSQNAVLMGSKQSLIIRCSYGDWAGRLLEVQICRFGVTPGKLGLFRERTMEDLGKLSSRWPAIGRWEVSDSDWRMIVFEWVVTGWLMLWY